MKKRSEGEQPIEAVEMVRRIRDAHYERFKDRPIEERLAYYRMKARAFEEGTGRGPAPGQEGAVGADPTAVSPRAGRAADT